MEEVVLVNEQDEVVGTMEKMQAHREGWRHRAFSVFIFNDRGEMLLQRRALGKYHSPGLWTNACCSHPRMDEAVEAAAQRRLREELDFTTPLESLGVLLYRADVGGGLIEHEYDHLFIGQYSLPVTPNEGEVSETKYVAPDALKRWMQKAPHEFTAWFHLALPKVVQAMESRSISV